MDFLVFQYPMITVQACLDGILLGILFALIAYGMALQWGVMNIINIAQGDLVILGGYIAYFMYLYGIHPAWGVIVAPIIMYFDVSFEAPNSPGVFMEENIQPETKINLSNTHDKIGENSYAVSLTIKAEATYGEKTMFIAEVEQSGVFVLNNYNDEEIKDLIAVYCPSTLFPYAREMLSSMVSKGGFPALNLQPISFEALYAQAKDEQQTKN